MTSFTFSVKSANNTDLTNGALNLCKSLPDENTAKNLSIHSIEDQMSTPTTKTSSLTTSRAPNLFALSYILVVFPLFFPRQFC